MRWFGDSDWPFVESIFSASALALLVTITTILWILSIKKNSNSALAWCLLVVVLPLVGALFFVLFGYQHVDRPLSRKRKQRKIFQTRTRESRRQQAVEQEATENGSPEVEGEIARDLTRLARRFGAPPPSGGNSVQLFKTGQPAYEAMLQDIATAKHHIHLETYILQPDQTGATLVQALAMKARQGTEVRLVYDAMGSSRMPRRFLSPLLDAGGQAHAFLPMNPLRRRIQINMRNHRKILIVDGRIAYVGGLNHGDEYAGKDRRFGYWRDAHLRIAGPAVPALQLLFAEDWNFAANEDLEAAAYFPELDPVEDEQVQIVDSGPDREYKGIREIYFGAITRAKHRVWIASPYFIPDEGLLDAMCTAAYLGVDVRFLGLFHPDRWLPFFAGRYYWTSILHAGVKVYQYTRGMMHSKVMLVDGEWASVGTANLDNRSLHLNFEVNCLMSSPRILGELEAAFEQDLADSVRLDRHIYGRRPLACKVLENASRLFSPVL